MSSHSVAIFLLASLCLIAPVHARADIYKWIDERGVVNYGDAPPQRARDARPLDLDIDSVNVIPGIPTEELDRLRERDTRLRLQRLQLEVEELRAREAERAAAPTALPPEPEIYGYPVYGYGRPRHGRPDAGWPRRPAHPIAKRRPPEFAPLPELRAPFPNQGPDLFWKR